MGFRKELEETNENEGYPKSPFISILPSFKKKILGERDPNAHLDATPKEKSLIQDIHPYSVPYDPVNNFTSPRPAFLRYNPDRRKEILLRMRNEEVSVSGSEISQDQENSFEEDLDSISSDLSLEDVEPDDDEEEEVQERRPWRSRMVWILLLLGVLLLSHLFLFPTSSPSGPSRQNNLSTRKSMYRDLLNAHIGLSDMCLDIGEGMCDFAVSDGSVMGHLGDSVKIESLMPGEIDEGQAIDGVEVAPEKDEIFVDDVYLDEVDSDEEESIDEVEAVPEKDAIFLDEANVEELMVEESREEPVSSYESPEQEEILGDQAIENLSKSVEGPDDQFVFDEAQDEESESLLIPEFESVEGLLQHDQATEESELSTVDETLSWWKLGFELAFDDVQLLLASLSSLAVITSLLIGLSMYFARPQHKSLLMPSPSHNFLPSDKPVDEKMASITSNSYKHKEPVPAPKMEELRSEGKYSCATPLSSSYSGAGLCATRPPTVELLGEFSIVDAVPDRTTGSKGYKKSEFSKTEGSGRVEIKSSPFSSKVHPFQAAEYTSLRSYTVQERPEKREDSDQKNAAKKVITPLRRSSRLQHRMTSTP